MTGEEAGYTGMLELNRVERRSLLLATALLVFGATVRFGVGPGAATYRWDPNPDVAADARPGPAEVREEVRKEIARSREAARPLSPGERIDPNRASLAQLSRLPGIGPARAAAIIRERKTEGEFRTAADLQRVRGLGPGSARRLAPFLSLPALPVAGNAAGVVARTATRGGSRSRLPPRVDLNRANLVELQRLPGIGAHRAARILEARERKGRFRSAAELAEIPGIGPATMRRLEGRVQPE